MTDSAETELTDSRLLRLGWARVWRTTALGGLISLMPVWVTTRLMVSRGVKIVPWLSVLNWLLYVLISLGVLRSVLKKRFRDFSFHLVKEG